MAVPSVAFGNAGPSVPKSWFFDRRLELRTISAMALPGPGLPAVESLLKLHPSLTCLLGEVAKHTRLPATVCHFGK